jgi:hypothetical protein
VELYQYDIMARCLNEHRHHYTFEPHCVENTTNMHYKDNQMKEDSVLLGCHIVRLGEGFQKFRRHLEPLERSSLRGTLTFTVYIYHVLRNSKSPSNSVIYKRTCHEELFTTGFYIEVLCTHEPASSYKSKFNVLLTPTSSQCRYALHNVSVSDGPHTRRCSHKIIKL